MGHGLQPVQAEEAAGPLEGVEQPENAVQQGRVGGTAFQPQQVQVDLLQVFPGLDHEIGDQFLHGGAVGRTAAGR